ncbi:MAG: nuclear transport factor 2 family protein [Flavobacteriales bacterium]|nr:nuclear transport factor 2 family protein [Flavobacteriales bacterium]
MKNIITLQLIIYIGVFSYTQNSDIIAIQQMMNNQVAAWNKGNLEEFMQGYLVSDSLLFIGKNGRNYGWKTTLNNYRNNYPDVESMGILSFDAVKFEKLHAKIYFVTGQWKLVRSNGNLKGWFSLIIQKIKGKWKITHDHSS